jgi:abequosyltransferase
MYSASPILSFAIPTYNFGQYLASTVHSIYQGARRLHAGEIEVVIVDGASSDDTPEIAKGLCQQYPSIRYVRMAQRGGIDFDMNHAANLCSADYFWLMSADDILVAGWDEVLLPALEKYTPDIALVSATLCSVTMEPLREHKAFDIKKHVGPVVFDWAKSDTLCQYLKTAQSLEALFSYMSAVVVRRQVWHALPQRSDYYGSCWAHCARLMPLLIQTKNPPTQLLYLHQFLINKRTGNDSFMDQGFLKRLAITVNGWIRLAEEFFPTADLRSAVYRLMYLDASWLNIAYAKLGVKDSAQAQQVIGMARTIYMQGQSKAIARFKLMALHCIPCWPSMQRCLQTCVPLLSYWRHKLKGWKK